VSGDFHRLERGGLRQGRARLDGRRFVAAYLKAPKDIPVTYLGGWSQDMGSDAAHIVVVRSPGCTAVTLLPKATTTPAASDPASRPLRSGP
jgi:hypothetical protein